MATKIHRLSNKYPRTDIRKKKWVKKTNKGKGDWHWKITTTGEKALKKKKRR